MAIFKYLQSSCHKVVQVKLCCLERNQLFEVVLRVVLASGVWHGSSPWIASTRSTIYSCVNDSALTF